MSDQVDHQTSSFSVLPESCIANIISLTSAKDACRLAAVSEAFKSAADSDTVWERFLPHNFKEIFSRVSSPLSFYTNKQLYFLLYDSDTTLLLDAGTMSCGFHGKTGKIWFKIGARKLQIASSDDPKHWQWTSVRESSFAEVTELQSITILDIHGKIEARMLSPNTTYSAMLIYRLTMREDGLDVPSKASIKFVEQDGMETEIGTETIYLAIPHDRDIINIDGRLSWALIDDWYGIELGEFTIGEGDSFDILFRVFETERLNQKRGLIVECIDVFPLDSPRLR